MNGMLLIAPLLYLAIYFGYFFLRDRIVPPLSENFFFAGLLALALRISADDSSDPWALACFAVGTFLMVLHLINYSQQKTDVEERVSSALASLPEGPRGHLIYIVKAAVEPDYIPNSWVNRWSRCRRTKVRRELAQYINEMHELNLEPDSFFPAGYREDSTVTTTKWLFGFSIVWLLLGSYWDPFATAVRWLMIKMGW